MHYTHASYDGDARSAAELGRSERLAAEDVRSGGARVRELQGRARVRVHASETAAHSAHVAAASAASQRRHTDGFTYQFGCLRDCHAHHHSKTHVIALRGHTAPVFAVDVSADGACAARTATCACGTHTRPARWRCYAVTRSA